MSRLQQVIKVLYSKIFSYTPEEIELEKNNIERLLKEGIKENTILLIEPNPFHGECLPSYVNYFLEFGFNVHLFTSKENIIENPFINCNFPEDKFKIISFEKVPSIDYFMKYLLNYKYIFLTSMLFLGNTYYANLLYENYSIKYKKNNLFLISHELDSTKYSSNFEILHQNNIFVLRQGVQKNELTKEFPFVSPIYFGEFPDLIKEKKAEIVKFLAVGGNYKKNLRNYDNIIDSMRKLRDSGITNFEIIFIGNPNQEFKEKANKEFAENIRFTGRVNFADLYKYHQECDYILFNIDKNTAEYELYLHKKISGSYSTSIGFLRPGLIDSDLAKEYKLENCSICYDEGKLLDAMKQAILLPQNKYIDLQNNLKQLSEILQKQSKENLKEYFYDKSICHNTDI